MSYRTSAARPRPSGLALVCIPILLFGLSSGDLAAQKRSRSINIDEELRGKKPQDRALAYYHFTIALLYAENEDYEKAITEFRKAIDYDGASAELRAEFAKILLQYGSVTEAISECQRAIELDPNNLDAHLLLGQIYAQFRETNKDFMQKAIKEFEEALRIDPDHYPAAITLGQLYLANQQHDKAVSIFERAARLRPEAASAHYLIAQAYLKMGRIEDAVASIKKAIEVEPDQVRNWMLLAELCERTKRNDELIQACRKILELDPNNAEAKRRLSAALLEAQRYEEAAKTLEDITREDPSDAYALVQLGKAYLNLRKPEKGLAALERAVELSPQSVEANFYLALAYEENGKSEEAIRRLTDLYEAMAKPQGEYTQSERENRALMLRQVGIIYLRIGESSKAVETLQQIINELGGSARDYELLASAYRSNRQHQKALAVNRQGLQKYPDDKYLRLQNAQLVALNGEVKDGVNLIERMLASDPKDIEAYLTLSQIYLQAKQYDKAEDTLRRAAHIDKDNENIKFQLGAVYERAKNYEKAEQVFLEIIRKNPQNASALNYLGYMWADLGVKLEQALDLVKRAVELEPHNGAYLDSLGWAYFKLNDLKLAEENLIRAVNRLRNDPTIHDHLGDLYFKMGDYAKAEEAWQKALANGTEDFDVSKVKEKINNLRKLRNSSKKQASQ